MPCNGARALLRPRYAGRFSRTSERCTGESDVGQSGWNARGPATRCESIGDTQPASFHFQPNCHQTENTTKSKTSHRRNVLSKHTQLNYQSYAYYNLLSISFQVSPSQQPTTPAVRSTLHINNLPHQLSGQPFPTTTDHQTCCQVNPSQQPQTKLAVRSTLPNNHRSNLQVHRFFQPQSKLGQPFH